MSNLIYSVNGARGRHIDVYDDKCVITTKLTIGSFLGGTTTDGEKTIYYVDCVGVQHKKPGLTLGYLQLETASALSRHKSDDFFNENTFTYENRNISEVEMKKIVEYVQQKVAEAKSGKNMQVVVKSPAEELKSFKELLDCGIITQEEFDKKKKEILG